MLSFLKSLILMKLQYQMTDMERYVVIEDFNGNINLVVDEDTGLTKVFDTYEEALSESKDCQSGIVVKL